MSTLHLEYLKCVKKQGPMSRMITKLYVKDVERNRTGRVPPRRRAAMLVAVVAVLGGGLLTSAIPAAAAVPGLESVSATLVASANQSQSVTVNCPPGKELISAGGYITGGLGSVAMDDVFPNEATDSVTVTGKETDPYGGAWRPTAVATCAPALPGLEWIQAQSPNDSSDKSVEASCPAGKTLVGIGYTIENGFGEVVVKSIAPQSALGGGGGPAATSVIVEAVEEGPGNYAPAWTLNAFAGCADPLAGQNVIKAQTPMDSTDPKPLSAVCPLGQVATGVAGSSGVTDPADKGNTVIDDMVPNNVDTGIAPTQANGFAFVEDPFVGAFNSWALIMYALCADA
jgi:hypothetical protein